MTEYRKSLGPIRFVVAILLAEFLVAALVIVWRFPYDTDGPVDRNQALRDFYATAYSVCEAKSGKEQEREARYVRTARLAAEAFDIDGVVRRFVAKYDLKNAKVLDVGSGRGYLQDVVDDYTGLDISSTAARFYHRRFVNGTATDIPFGNGEFDAAWSIWVLEHIPNPQAALMEIRRVVKPGGVLLLAPAWNCSPWAADGYEVRPFSDFGIGGKLVKASLSFQNGGMLSASQVLAHRSARMMAGLSKSPTRLHYRRLTPNYLEYWTNDSDAVNSLDPLEVAMWFESRGDKCLNCGDGMRRLGLPAEFFPLEIRIGSR